jgi:hypothetical protein
MNTESGTPTPRTDAHERHYIETGNVSKLINLARELERELAEAKKHCDPYEREAAKAAINVLKRDLVESKKNECDTCDAYTLANRQLREDLANLAKQRVNGTKNFMTTQNSESETAPAVDLHCVDMPPCLTCGNTFIECFGGRKSWWAGCKPCNNHVHAKSREEALRQWERRHNHGNKMSTYRKITILFADEEPAAAYSDKSIAQVMLERCEEWQQKELEISSDYVVEAINAYEYRDKKLAHNDAHPLDPSYVNAQYYALKTVYLYE